MLFKLFSFGQIFTNKILIVPLSSLNRRTIVADVATNTNVTTSIFTCIELDSNDRSIVVGTNCCIIHYTSRECDVSPYRDDYASIKNVPIVQAATAYQ